MGEPTIAETTKWYVLAIPKGDGWEDVVNEMSNERFEFDTIEEAREARDNCDCSEAIGIMEETRRWVPEHEKD